ncbi:MAG: hypothetical protein KKB21_04170, partial [Nanoarchaeota archaeon]|nr:hypothetical protein [Nanoarchaeota archaeon]
SLVKSPRPKLPLALSLTKKIPHIIVSAEGANAADNENLLLINGGCESRTRCTMKKNAVRDSLNATYANKKL